MFTIRPSDERGSANFGWLDSKHSFSFGNYYDANHMGFRNLRVINEDKVLPNQGFGTLGHRDMEIISYVISGSLEHRDSIHPHIVTRLHGCRLQNRAPDPLRIHRYRCHHRCARKSLCHASCCFATLLRKLRRTSIC